MLSKYNVVFYSVMMFDFEQEGGSLNGLSGTFKEKISKHVNMCDLLCMSLKNFGYKHRVFTNSIKVFTELSCRIEIYDGVFHLDLSHKIDKSIPFYLAMHKLELSGLIKSNEEYSIILDNDCVMVNDLPVNYINAMNAGMASVYQITEQVTPAYGIKKVMSDVLAINGNSNLGLWFGGEIFGGLSSHFQLLNNSYCQLVEKFNYNISKFNHCGDENILTNFIQEQMLGNNSFFDLGQTKVISRFWSCKTMHFPTHWKTVAESSLLHLPGDKDFLSNYVLKTKYCFEPDHFRRSYQEYLNKKGYLIDVDFFSLKKKSLFERLLLWFRR